MVPFPIGVDNLPSVDEQSPSKDKQRGELNKFIKRLFELETTCKNRGLNLDYYFIELEKRGKEPVSRWKNRVANSLSLTEVQDRILYDYGNFGVVATNDPDTLDDKRVTICFVDLDLDQNGNFKLPRKKVFELLRRFDSFTVKTRSGGYHIYFAVTAPEAWEVCKQYGKNSILKHEGADFGEFRFTDQYVVGVGSYIPINDQTQNHGSREEATGYYEVEIDKPIQFITAKDLETLLHKNTCFTPIGIGGAGVVNHELIKEIRPDNIVSTYGQTLEEVRAQNIELDNLLSGAGASLTSKNPEKKPDKSRMDFSTVLILKNHGFTPEQAWVILRAYRPYDKMIERDDYLDLTIDKAYHGEGSFPSKHSVTQTLGDPSDTETKEIVLPQFPDILPEIPLCTHIWGLPRRGKSYFCLKLLWTVFASGVYVAPNHDIVEQNFARFTQQNPSATCVRLLGKTQEGACTHMNANGQKYDCSHCPRMPLRSKKNADLNNFGADPITYNEMETVAKQVVMRFKHIDLSTFMRDDFHALFEADGKSYCPYYLLHLCEREVDYVFTIPHYTTVPEGEITSIREREVCVIDEDPSFASYFPRDVDLVEFGHHKKSTTIKRHIIDYADLIDHFKADITSIYKKDENGKQVRKEKRNLKNHEKVICALIRSFEAILSHITQFKDGNEKIEFDELVTAVREIPIQPQDELELALYQDDSIKQKVLREIDRYDRRQGSESKRALRPLFEALLYPYVDYPFDVMGKNPRKLSLVGDKETIIQKPRCARQYILIGFNKAAHFAKQLFPNSADRIRYRINGFPYKQNFTILVVCGETAKQEQMMLQSFIRMLLEGNQVNDWKVPAMILTSSKKRQEALAKKLPDGTTYNSRRESRNSLIHEWCKGSGVIFYQNSTISRGIDIPWMDLLIVDSCAFAQPYWHAVQEYCKQTLDGIASKINQEKSNLEALDHRDPTYRAQTVEIQKKIDELIDLRDGMKDELEERAKRAKDIQDSHLMDETTNSVLRPTPVNGKRDDQAKFIVIPERYLAYLNPEVTQDMRMVWLTSDAHLLTAVDLVRKAVTKVHSEAIMLKGTGHALTEITEYTDEDIEKASKIEGIHFGMSYSEVAPLIQELETDLGSSENQPSSDQKFDEISVIEKMVKHSAFNRWKKGNKETVGTGVDSLIRWTRGRNEESPSVRLCKEAVMYMIQHNWVSVKRSDPVREHSTLERDDARRNDSLYMTQENIAAIQRETMGRITISPKPPQSNPHSSDEARGKNDIAQAVGQITA